METDQKTKSDYVYIKSTIESFYHLDQANIKISPVYMGGRGNYASPKIKKRIEKLKKDYSRGSDKNRSVVIYCFDCDNYDKNPTDAHFLEKARRYCRDLEYRYVWFCKDIEDVYLGRSIPDNQKKKESETFKKRKKINNIHIESLKETTYASGKSNLCKILDEYLG